MQKILAKCHSLVGHFKYSAVVTDSLIKKKRDWVKELLCVVQEVAKRRKSIFYMMLRLVQLKQPICLYLQNTMTEDEMKSYNLSEHQWLVEKAS